MNSAARFLICFSAGIVLCQCTGPKEKKVDSTEQTLEKRTTSGMDLTKRSRYEKSISDSKLTGNNAGSYFQKQTHHSKSFIGADSYAGQKQFKTNQSIFGKSKAKGLDMTYALGNKHAGGAKNSFKTETSRFDSQQARESKSMFGGGDNSFKTGSALTRRKSIGKPPHIIENYNDRGGGKKSAYTEDEVRKLMGRN
jgi:hypothetical protein